MLLLPDGDTEAVKVPDEEVWTTLRQLSRDPIVGVRIGVSRLIAGLYGKALLLREEIRHQFNLQHTVGRGRVL